MKLKYQFLDAILLIYQTTLPKVTKDLKIKSLTLRNVVIRLKMELGIVILLFPN